jgi:hypothetical protein
MVASTLRALLDDERAYQGRLLVALKGIRHRLQEFE